MLGEETHFISLVTVDRRPLLLRAPEIFYGGWDGVRPDAWVVLPDHIHAVVRPSPYSIYDLVAAFQARYSRLLNSRSNGSIIFRDYIYDQPLRSTDDLCGCLDFIHFDPVRHGLTDQPWRYPHSSFPLYVSMGMYDLDWTLDK